MNSELVLELPKQSLVVLGTFLVFLWNNFTL